MGQLFEFIDADRDGWIKAFEITKFLCIIHMYNYRIIWTIGTN